MRIPEGRESDGFDNFDLSKNPGMEEALMRCLDVAHGLTWCALLVGGFGTGKTHLAIAAVRTFAGRTGHASFWKVPDYLQWLRRKAFGQNATDDVDELTEAYRTGLPNLVVFDDLGTENRTEWAGEQLYRILDARSDRCLPTIITTNQDPERIDGRILSRFRAGLILCRGKDIRAHGPER